MAQHRHDLPRAALVVLAAGEGRRVGHDTNKVLLPLAGHPVFTWSLRRAGHLAAITHRVLVIREEDRAVIDRTLRDQVERPEDLRIVVGGESRHGSEWNALQALASEIEAGAVDVIVIHDAARPLAPASLFADVIAAADEHGGALPVRDQGHLAGLTVDDPAPTDRIVAVQTPQAFRARPLLDAYRAADAEGFVGTDTATSMERYVDLPVRCVPGDARNIKITFPEDLVLAERLLARVHGDARVTGPAGPPRRGTPAG